MTRKKPDPVEPPSFEPAPDRPKALPFGGELETLEAAVGRLGPVRVRNAGRSAFMHLRKAWVLHPVDSEMSLFRALTGVEEAASALILALKQQRYPGADRLNAQDHVHKAAIWPIIEAIIRGFVDKGVPRPQVLIKAKGRPQIRLEVDLGPLLGMDYLGVHSPDPFHVVIHSDENGPFAVHRWGTELAQVAGDEVDIEQHIRDAANLRNRILYAGEGGLPAVRFADDAILLRLAHVQWIMVATIGILQTKNHQFLVTQALETLLKTIRRFAGEDYAFPQYGPPQGPHLAFEQQADASLTARFVAP